ncbi:MAG: cytochrome b N-terminal domain-containing protein [Aestuariivirga sp.]
MTQEPTKPSIINPPEYAASANAFKTLADKVYIHKLPSYGNKIFYGLGFLALMSLVVLVVTGCITAFMGQSWWLFSSFGAFTRSVHLWSVQAFVSVLTLHFLVGFFTSAFRPPRRMVWVFGAMIFCLALIQTEFGYGLRGDFSSQWRAVSGADFWNGAYLGWWVDPLSALQVFPLHVAIIPIAIIMLFIAHYILVHAYGISKPYRSDVVYKMVPANHRVMYIRGLMLVAAIAVMAYFFPSPYVPAIQIADVAAQDPALITKTLQQEYDHTSGTATYLDSIDPYNFDTRKVFVTAPYEKLVGSTPPAAAVADQSVMINALLPAAKSGAYESLLSSEDSVHALRFLSDLDVISKKALALNMATEQWGMAREETGSLLKLPPGPWWFAPIGALNSSFNLLNNKHGDRVAAQLLGLLMLIFIAFPYIPFVNRLPKFLPFARLIWRDRDVKK